MTRPKQEEQLLLSNIARSFLSLAISLALLPAQQQERPVPKYKIEILSAAGNPKKRKKNVISSESVIRVSDTNDVPVAGVTVMFAISQLSGGSAAFANGAASTIVTTNAAGIASTGAVSASTASTFNIGVSATVAGQPLTATVPVNMSAVAGSAGGAGAGGAAAGGAAGAGGGISGAMIGVIVAVAAGAAVAAGVALSGGKNTPAAAGPTPTTAGPTIRIGGPGIVTIGPPRP